MKMILTAGVLSAALFLAVVSAVQAKKLDTDAKPTVTPIVVIGE